MASALNTNNVTVLYNDILFRGATVGSVTEASVAASEISGWASGLDAGLFTLSQVTSAFVNSVEAQTFIDPIVRLYQGVFGRAADVGGLAYWATQERAGMSLTTIAQGFVNSAEFATDYGSPSSINPTAFVNALYLHVLGRTADAAGLANWLAVLGSTPTAAAITSVVLGFTNSAEFQTDISSPINTWLTNAANSALAGTTATTLGTATYGASLSTTGTGNTYTLTTGIDTIAVTASNSTINGTFGASTGNTYTAGDSISGGSTVGDTLNLYDQGTGGTGAPTAIVTTVSGIATLNIVSSEGITANTASSLSGFSGLTQLTVSAGDATHNNTVTAAGTTNITLTDNSTGAVTDTVNGGNNVVYTGSGVTGAATINVGQTTAAAGTVSVTENVATSGTGTYTAAAINAKGGTTITVAANLSEAVGTGTVTGGTVTVSGTGSTTTVSVTQSATATAQAAVAGVTYVPAVAAVTAAPGVQGVTAVTGVAAVKALTAAAGVVDGAVQVTDANYNTAGANTITSVSLANYGASSYIHDNALATLSLSGTAGTLAITNATSGGANPTSNSTLALTVNTLSAPAALGSSDAITDTNNEIKTLNVTTAGANSTLTAFTDTALTTLNVAGSYVLKMTTINTSLTALNISGAAGFNDSATAYTGGLAAVGATLTITDTSSGTFSAALNDTAQVFTGSTGQDVIIISDLADATKAITAGSATNNELILDGGAYALTSATAALVTGFQTLGVEATVTGTVNVGVLDATASKLDIIGNSTVSFIGVAHDAAVSLDASSTSVSVKYVDVTGSNDVVSVTLGTATTAAAITATALTLSDANLVGIGTLNIVSNDTLYNGTNNAITTLTDNGLAVLNVSGAGGLTIGTLNEASTQATTFTLNNTSTDALGVTISAFTDNQLGSLTFTGSGPSTITAFNDAAGTVNISNTGSSSATVGTFTDASLTSMTLSAGVALGVNSATLATEAASGLQDSSTAGVTVSGSADNAHVVINLTAGAAAGNTDSITLGNGNNYVIDKSDATTATVNVTVGTGSNLIVLGTAGNATESVYNVTLGTHTSTTGIDSITVNNGGANYATAVNNVITNAVKGDVITFGNDASSSNAALTATAAGATVAATITAIEAAAHAIGAHGVAYSVFGGNTYVAETLTGTLAATDTTIVELVGTHTFTPSTGFLTLAS